MAFPPLFAYVLAYLVHTVNQLLERLSQLVYQVINSVATLIRQSFSCCKQVKIRSQKLVCADRQRIKPAYRHYSMPNATQSLDKPCLVRFAFFHDEPPITGLQNAYFVNWC